MKAIPLTQSKATIVDAADYELLMQYKWYAHFNGFGWVAIGTVDTGYEERMHRFLLNPREDQEVDHRNHNSLDNRRSNIRICSRSDNQANVRPKGRYSRYKGVSYNFRAKRFVAQVRKNGAVYNLGYFKTEEEAALAYDAKAREVHGEFAFLNFK